MILKTSNFARRYLPIIAILLVATYLRWVDIGGRGLSTDESTHTLLAYRIVDGDFHLQGPPMSVGLRHSPFSIYLYALPFAVTPDPRVARLFTATLNVLAVALVYSIGRRFFSEQAGLIAALLYAIHPDAVYTARGIWNPRLAAPFVMAFIATGLTGYLKDRRAARLAHLPLLSLAVQCHPMTVLLAPITPLLWVAALRRDPHRWRVTVIDLLVGGLLAGLLLLPLHPA